MKGAEATIRIGFPSERKAIVVLDALKPETETSPTHRSEVTIRREGRTLIFFFRAKDATALRASINSYTRWMMAVNDTLSKTESMEMSELH